MDYKHNNHHTDSAFRKVVTEFRNRNIGETLCIARFGKVMDAADIPMSVPGTIGREIKGNLGRRMDTE